MNMFNLPARKLTVLNPLQILNLLNRLSFSFNQASIFTIMLLLGSAIAFSQANDPVDAAQRMKQLSLEELMEIEVTSVSRGPEKLIEVASPVQVLTNQDIHRSSATRLPEALRLAPNLMAAQLNSHDWAISSRGFNGAPLTNNSMASKMQVMIDGRTVYTPLFGGVFWDIQNVLLEDLDKIEIISGPGGTLWGPNAMNGVINVNSKSARETQGLYATAALGNFLQNHFAARYGQKLGNNLYSKVYIQRWDYDNTMGENEAGQMMDATDAWHMTQGGLRLDYYPSDKSTLTVDANFYGGKEEADLGNKQNGQSVRAKWTHAFDEKSQLAVQLYYDRTWRTLPGRELDDELQTYDLDLQQSWNIRDRHRVIAGVGYRLLQSRIRSQLDTQFIPSKQDMPLYQAFVEDKIEIVPDKLDLTLGVKALHNFFSGFEWQPNARISWNASEQNTFWASVSRAIRAPTRFDVDISSPSVMAENGEFESEKLLAYQIGHRLQFLTRGTLSTTLFYHDYSDLRSFNSNDAAPPTFLLSNDQSAKSKGFEIAASYFISEKWRMRAGYTFIETELKSENPTVVQPLSSNFESVDPKYQFMIHSILDLPAGLQFDVDARYIDGVQETLYNPEIDSYLSLNARIGWEYKKFELSIVGQNLTQKYHQEFSALSIPRNIYARVICRL